MKLHFMEGNINYQEIHDDIAKITEKHDVNRKFLSQTWRWHLLLRAWLDALRRKILWDLIFS